MSCWGWPQPQIDVVNRATSTRFFSLLVMQSNVQHFSVLCSLLCYWPRVLLVFNIARWECPRCYQICFNWLHVAALETPMCRSHTMLGCCAAERHVVHLIPGCDECFWCRLYINCYMNEAHIWWCGECEGRNVNRWMDLLVLWPLLSSLVPFNATVPTTKAVLPVQSTLSR